MLKKLSAKELVEYESHLHILVLNDMWVKWVSEMWDYITIYGKNESGLLFVNEPGLLFADGERVYVYIWLSKSLGW